MRLYDNTDFDCKTPTFEILLDCNSNYIVRIVYSPLAYMDNTLSLYVPRTDLKNSLYNFSRIFREIISNYTDYVQNYKDIKKKLKKEGFIEKTKLKEFVLYTKKMLF